MMDGESCHVRKQTARQRTSQGPQEMGQWTCTNSQAADKPRTAKKTKVIPFKAFGSHVCAKLAVALCFGVDFC